MLSTVRFGPVHDVLSRRTADAKNTAAAAAAATTTTTTTITSSCYY